MAFGACMLRDENLSDSQIRQALLWAQSGRMTEVNKSITIERLVGRENWSTWRFAVQTLLEVEDLWIAVEPIVKPDGTVEPVDP
uniref:Uncharacterized protein n=1 Tax=Anopheles atroparvus TaxID=41427 RepID=A0AAG5DPK1_ANOAO